MPRADYSSCKLSVVSDYGPAENGRRAAASGGGVRLWQKSEAAVAVKGSKKQQAGVVVGAEDAAGVSSRLLPYLEELVLLLTS